MSADALRLDLQSLSAHFAEATFAAGLALYRSQQVINCELSRVNTREWGLAGIVQGGQKARQRHQVSVVLETSPNGDITFFSGSCDCGAGSTCRHSAALAVKAAYRSGHTQASVPKAVPARPSGPSLDLFAEPAQAPVAPEAAPPEAVPALKPTTQLHIEAIAPELVPQRGLFSATLRFNYAGLLHYALNDYNPVQVPSILPGAVDGRQLLHRDLRAEHAAHDQLRLLGLAGDTRGQFIRPFISASQQQPWLQWLDDDFAVLRSAGFDVTAAPDLASRITHASDLAAQLDADAGDLADLGNRSTTGAQGGWFRLSLGMQIDGTRRNILPLLPELLAQLGITAAGQPGDDNAGSGLSLQLPPYLYLQQADGRYWRLPCEPLRPWLQALLALAAERGTHGRDDLGAESLRLSRMEALQLGVALQTGRGTRAPVPIWQGAESLQELTAQLSGHTPLPETPAPAGLQATLRPYQLQGLHWLQFLSQHELGGILADDMGLGKTLQTLAHIQCEKEAGRLDRPVLVIAPLSLMGNWRREAGRFTPDLRVSVIQGHKRQRALARMGGCDIVIAPYSLLQRDRVHWLQQAWHVVVLDEAQHIKNAGSQAARVVGELNTRYRLCISGTPVENHLGELWSLFNFLMPGFLGTAARFKALFRTPIEKQGHRGQLAHLRERVAPFMLRRTKGEVATDLPPKQEILASVTFSDGQADLYEAIRLSTENAVRDALANKGLVGSQFQILEALMRLRQVCCDPRLLPSAGLADAVPPVSSAKLDWLMDTLPRMLEEGRRVLVFSQFTSMLALIEKALAERHMEWVTLTGQSQNREAIIEHFTSGQVPLFLVSLKAGGVGLNLPQADTVIHFDPWWNPAVQEQTTARAHRIGQTQPVMVYRLVAQGTVEERILALQERKAALAGGLYGDADHLAAQAAMPMTEEDLAGLLTPLDQ